MLYIFKEKGLHKKTWTRRVKKNREQPAGGLHMYVCTYVKIRIKYIRSVSTQSNTLWTTAKRVESLRKK